MAEADSQKRGGREGERAGGKGRKKMHSLGKMSRRFHHVLVESKEFGMEREASGQL